VLDVDVKAGRDGMALYDRARHAGLLSGAAALIRTPSGGLHLWFEGTGQSGGAVGKGKALELKARGGYVLVPPSYVEIDAYAGRYELVERRDTPAPSTSPRPGGCSTRRPSGPLARRLVGQAEGNRNGALYWARCRALESGHDDLTALLVAAGIAGLPDVEARRTVESARRRIRGAS
jgi:hypothetical protein